MKCSFEDKRPLPEGGWRHTTCVREAKIMRVHDPCYGLCYQCAYEKLRVENERLKRNYDSSRQISLS